VRRYASAHETSPWLPLASIAATIVTWGLASPLIKLASVGGVALAFHRLWIGAALLVTVMALGRQPVGMRAMRYAVPAGALFGANMMLFVAGVKNTTVANATLIGALQPAITLLVAGRYFGETVTPREVACVSVAIAGVAIVIVGSSGTPEWNPVGDLYAVGAVLTFTVYFLVTKRARETVGTLEYMTGVHVAAALVALCAVLLTDASLWDLSAGDIGVILFIAFVSGTGGQLVIGWAQRFVDVSLSSLMLLGVPVVAAVAAWLMLDEALTLVQIAGGAVTLAAIGYMVQRSRPAPAFEPLSEGVAGGGA